MRCGGSPPTGGSPRASSCPAAGEPSGARPGCSGCCAAAAWPSCAGRPSRCRRRCWPDSCPPGRTRPARPAPAEPAAPGRVRTAPPTADAVYDVIEQLAGAAIPASALETLVLPARVPGYSPALLDELTAAGEIVWSGAGGLLRRATAGWCSPPPTPHRCCSANRPRSRWRCCTTRCARPWTVGARCSSARSPTGSGPRCAATASRRRLGLTDQTLAAAIWDLVWAGRLTNDTLAPLRTVLSTGRPVAATESGPGVGQCGTAAARAAAERAWRWSRYGTRRPQRPHVAGYARAARRRRAGTARAAGAGGTAARACPAARASLGCPTHLPVPLHGG